MISFDDAIIAFAAGFYIPFVVYAVRMAIGSRRRERVVFDDEVDAYLREKVRELKARAK